MKYSYFNVHVYPRKLVFIAEKSGLGSDTFFNLILLADLLRHLLSLV